MSTPPAPRRQLSTENSERLNEALLLTQTLRTTSADGDTKLVELRSLLDRCRDGIRTQRPGHARHRLEAIDQARNYLHFLPYMKHPQAEGRLKSVSNRIRRALRSE